MIRAFEAYERGDFSDSHAQSALIERDSVVVGATLCGQGRQSGISADFTFWLGISSQIVHGQDCS